MKKLQSSFDLRAVIFYRGIPRICILMLLTPKHVKLLKYAEKGWRLTRKLAKKNKLNNRLKNASTE